MFSMSFKQDVNTKDLSNLTKNCQLLLLGLIKYCAGKEIPLVITSLISDRDGVKSSSSTHREGRAFDVRTFFWSDRDIEDCVVYFNTYFRNIAAVSASDKIPRAAVYGDEKHMDHIHFQVRRDGL